MEAAPASMPVRRLIVALALALPFVFAASAHAYVYWGDPQAGTIGRANNDGTGATDSFIRTGGSPIAIAVNSTSIFWADETDGTIGRANIDGSDVEPNFITGIKEPHGVAVNSSGIFWASLGGNAIGRANLNGTGKNLELVTGIGSPCSIAIDSGHIYWGSIENIGRAPLSGGTHESEWVHLSSTFIPCAIAVNSANVFFGNTGFLGGGGKEIDRVGITGMGLDESVIGEAEDPCGMTVSGTKLYWANEADGTIGAANTDATSVNEELVQTGASGICGVAVDSLSSPLTPTPTPTPPSPTPIASPAPAPPTPGTIRFVKLKPDAKKGTGRLSVAVNEAGTVSVTGKGIAPATAKARGAETVTLVVKAAKSKGPTLKKTGRLAVKLAIVFKPSDGGAQAKLGKNVTLRERSVHK